MFPLINYINKKALFGILFLTFVMAVLDVAGLLSIAPFLALLMNPDLINEVNLLNDFQEFTGLSNNLIFLTLLGAILIALQIMGLLFKIYVLWRQTLFVHNVEANLSTSLIHTYLCDEFIVYRKKDPVQIQKRVLNEVTEVVHGTIMASIHVISNTLVAISLCTAILLYTKQSSWMVLLFLTISYFLAYKITRQSSSKLGEKRLKLNTTRFNLVNEATYLFKLIRLHRLEDQYRLKMQLVNRSFARAQALSQLIGFMPRYIFEVIGIVIVMTAAMYTLWTNSDPDMFIGQLAFYAIAGYRLFPAFQQIYQNAIRIRYTEAACLDLANELTQTMQLQKIKCANTDIGHIAEVSLCDACSVRSCDEFILTDQNLVFRKGQLNFIVGSSGVGKSTLIDMILGLNIHDIGAISVNGIPLNDNTKSNYTTQIGYVPQEIFLQNTTVYKNLMLLSSDAATNINIEKILQDTQIDFLDRNDPFGKYYEIGERGNSLSGGQRQRLALARALCSNPQILVLDEPTSALDTRTEKLIFDMLRNKSKDIIVIVVTHNSNILSPTDNIYRLT